MTNKPPVQQTQVGTTPITETAPVVATPPTAAQATEPKDHLLSNGLYDVTKFVAVLLLPAIGALYFAFAGALNLPDPTSVVGTITAVDAALGGLLKAGDVSYGKSNSKFDGEMQVAEQDAKKVYSLVLKADPQFIEQGEQFLLKVVSAK